MSDGMSDSGNAARGWPGKERTDRSASPPTYLINPDALTHLPCSKCGKPADQIDPLAGRVAYTIQGKLTAITGRECGDCAPPSASPAPAPQSAKQHFIVRDCRFDPPPQPDDETRCALCGWPLSESRSQGCVRGDCSMRPRPAHLYAPERAAREAAPAQQGPENVRRGEAAEQEQNKAGQGYEPPPLRNERRADIDAQFIGMGTDAKYQSAVDEVTGAAQQGPERPDFRLVLQDLLNNQACSCSKSEPCSRCQIALNDAREALAAQPTPDQDEQLDRDAETLATAVLDAAQQGPERSDIDRARAWWSENKQRFIEGFDDHGMTPQPNVPKALAHYLSAQPAQHPHEDAVCDHQAKDDPEHVHTHACVAAPAQQGPERPDLAQTMCEMLADLLRGDVAVAYWKGRAALEKMPAHPAPDLEGQWKRRALRFQEAYREAQAENTAYHIQKMMWEAETADVILRRQRDKAHDRMMAEIRVRRAAEERVAELEKRAAAPDLEGIAEEFAEKRIMEWFGNRSDTFPIEAKRELKADFVAALQRARGER